jgi:NAD-dependent dihydropyrimidine dehydrogenase PreA subunit
MILKRLKISSGRRYKVTSRKKIQKTDLNKLLNQWSQEFNVLVPWRGDESVSWTKWDGNDIGFMEWYRNTTVPAKANFLPSQEELFRFKKDDKGYKIELSTTDESKQLIFGIRPCDARALTIVAPIFEELYEDTYYLAKKNSTLLVGLGCDKPCDSCFCTSLSINPGESNDVDLMFTDIGEELLIEGISEKGKELIARTGEVKEATEADETRAKEVNEASYQKVTRKVDTENIKEKLLACFEEEKHWEKIADKCISCGVCTLMCPTCYCFDINDELVKKQGTRFRSWDSCAFSIYTKMPMENPREEKWRRVRQKVCHKFEFHPMSYGAIACVGCGRCIRRCPVNWDITQVLNNLPIKA